MKNIAIKNNNVGKKSLTLSKIYNNFNKIHKKVMNMVQNLIIRKPLDFFLGVCQQSEK